MYTSISSACSFLCVCRPYVSADHFAVRHSVTVDDEGSQEHLLHHTQLPHENPTDLYCEEVTLSTSSEQSISSTI